MGYSSYMEIQHFRILLHSIYIPCTVGMLSRWRQNNAIFFAEDYSAASDSHNVRKGMNGNEIYLKQRDLCGYRKWGEGNRIKPSLAIQTESTERHKQTDASFQSQLTTNLLKLSRCFSARGHYNTLIVVTLIVQVSIITYIYL